MIINPEVIVTPDCPTVRIRDAESQVDLEAELSKVLQGQGWGVGTYFHVQFLSHDKTTLLAAARFVVTQESEGLHTANPDAYQPITKTTFTRRFAQVEAWWRPERDEAAERPDFDVRWNLGAKAHEVVDNTGAVLAAFTREQGGRASAEAYVDKLSRGEAA